MTEGQHQTWLKVHTMYWRTTPDMVNTTVHTMYWRTTLDMVNTTHYYRSTPDMTQGQHQTLVKVNITQKSRPTPHITQGQHHTLFRVNTSSKEFKFFLMYAWLLETSRQKHACLWHRHTQKLSQAKNTKTTAQHYSSYKHSHKTR